MATITLVREPDKIIGKINIRDEKQDLLKADMLKVKDAFEDLNNVNGERRAAAIGLFVDILTDRYTLTGKRDNLTADMENLKHTTNQYLVEAGLTEGDSQLEGSVKLIRSRINTLRN